MNRLAIPEGYILCPNQIKEVLGSRMLEDIPKKNIVIRQFIPKVNRTALPSRAKDVGDGYYISIVRPTADDDADIRIELPEHFSQVCILLGRCGPIVVDSQEKYD